MPERIRWEDDGLSGNYTGHVGTLAEPAFRLFSPDAFNAEWLLSVRLFAGTKFFRGGDPEPLKAEAERWLEQFVSSLGAVFPDSPAASPGWTLRVHMQREPGSDRAACSNDPRFRAVTGDPSKVTCAACLQRHVASVNDALRALETGQ